MAKDTKYVVGVERRKSLTDFLKNHLSKFYTMFEHSQVFLIEEQIKMLEKAVITATEVKNILKDT